MDHRTLTREGLQRAKEAGKALGAANPVISAKLEGKRGWKKGTEASKLIRARLQRKRYWVALWFIKAYRADGLSYRAIADFLNFVGFRTSQGKPFSNAQVHRVLKREAELVGT